MAAMARGGRGAEDLVNPTGGDVSDASEPRICHLVPPCGRHSSVVRRRREDTCVCRKAKARDPRTQKCPAAVRGRRAAACRAGGPRVSETCDRSRDENQLHGSTPPVHFANGRRSVTVKVTVRGSASGFGVRGVVARTPRDREPACARARCGERTRRRERGCRL